MTGPDPVVAYETPRLRLRTFRPDDLAPLCAMNADAGVMEFLGGPQAPADTLAMAADIDALFRREGTGMIAVERRADGAFLGLVGLNRLDWYPDDLEVGWRLLPAHWGHGYAAEAGAAWLAHAFLRLGAPRVLSVADAPNARSRAVMARLGMRLDHLATLPHEGGTFEAAVHALTRAEWDARPGP